METDQIKAWIVLKTENYQEITKSLNKAYEYSLLSAIIGFPGAGKTTAFDRYLIANKNAIYLRLDKSFGPKDFYVHLLRKLGVLDYGYDIPIRFLAEKLATTLNAREGRALIIIDDAGRFSASMMEFFQQVFDETSGKTGLVLAGTQKFHKDFKDWAKKQKLGIPELDSRIRENWTILKEPSKEEMKIVAKKNGVSDESTLKVLLKGCTTYRQLNARIIDLRIEQVEKQRKKDEKKEAEMQQA